MTSLELTAREVGRLSESAPALRPARTLPSACYLLAVLAVVVGVVGMHSLTVGHRAIGLVQAAQEGKAGPPEADHAAKKQSPCVGHCEGDDAPSPARHAAAAICLAVLAAFAFAVAVAQLLGSTGPEHRGRRPARGPTSILRITQALTATPSLTRLCVLRI